MKKIFQFILFAVFGSFPMFVLAQTTTGIVSNLYQGLKSSEVTLLQQQLQNAGFFPKDTAPSGFFGPLTKAAVQAFQTAKGIESTGYVGPLTRRVLGGQVTAQTNLSAPTSVAVSATTGAITISMNLYQGINNPEVALLQQLLKDLGYFPGNTATTNFFGPATKAAVQAFQLAKGIDTTGYVGQLTRQALAATTPLSSTISKTDRATCLSDAARIHGTAILEAKQTFDAAVTAAANVRDAALSIAATTLSRAKTIAGGPRDAAFLNARTISDLTIRTNTIDAAIATYSAAIKPAEQASVAAQNAALTNYTSSVAQAQSVYDLAIKKLAAQNQALQTTCPAN